MSEREVVAGELNPAIEDLRREGFRLDIIYPADEPHTAILTRACESVRLTTRPREPRPPAGLPPFVPEFVLTHGGDTGDGRAGMLYRDLIPGRLGGRYIASHITIPGGGPVSDWVHFHRVALQLIYVRSGQVKVVYEDQGEPFIMNAGDLVLQPPGIRHRVLESSAGLEVIEVSAPALHETLADHAMTLPNHRIDRDRDFSSQRFLRHVAAEARWTAFDDFEAQETAMQAATGGLAEVRLLRPAAGTTVEIAPHDGELVFGFVANGSARLDYDDGFDLEPADAFVIPPDRPWGLSCPSDEFRLLHVATSRLG